MIIVCLKGGLGNQMFQIAFAHSIAKKLGVEYRISTENWHCGQGSHPSKYFKNIFKNILFISSPILCNKLLEKQIEHYSIIDDIRTELLRDNIIKIDGYFQSEKYFYNYDIKSLFDLDHSYIYSLYPELIIDGDRTFVGIRRGDYLPHAETHLPCNMDYFKKSMEYLASEKYYLMSDDMNWVKENFVGPQYIYLDIEDDLQALYAITLFSKYIISNSTFHWWGSYLSIYKDPVIIAPSKWASFKTSICRDAFLILK